MLAPSFWKPADGHRDEPPKDHKSLLSAPRATMGIFLRSSSQKHLGKDSSYAADRTIGNHPNLAQKVAGFGFALRVSIPASDKPDKASLHIRYLDPKSTQKNSHGLQPWFTYIYICIYTYSFLERLPQKDPPSYNFWGFGGLG